MTGAEAVYPSVSPAEAVNPSVSPGLHYRSSLDPNSECALNIYGITLLGLGVAFILSHSVIPLQAI